MSRSRTSPDDINTMADATMSPSLSHNPSWTASTATTLQEERNTSGPLNREIGAAPAGLSAVEAKLRVLQLKRDEIAAGAESPRRPTAGLFKSVCSTDLLFLIDTT